MGNIIWCSAICATGHSGDPTFLQPKSTCFMDPKMGCVIFVALRLSKLCMKMLHLKDFEKWVHNAIRKYDPPKGMQDAGVCGPAPVSQTVGYLAIGFYD